MRIKAKKLDSILIEDVTSDDESIVEVPLTKYPKW